MLNLPWDAHHLFLFQKIGENNKILPIEHRVKKQTIFSHNFQSLILKFLIGSQFYFLWLKLSIMSCRMEPPTISNVPWSKFECKGPSLHGILLGIYFFNLWFKMQLVAQP